MSLKEQRKVLALLAGAATAGYLGWRWLKNRSAQAQLESSAHLPPQQRFACAHQKRSKPGILMSKEQRLRHELIKNVVYDVNLTLSPSQTYLGQVRVLIDVLHPTEALFLDAKVESVHKIIINGLEIPDSRSLYESSRIALPGIKEGTNTVEVHFSNYYAHNPNGLNRYLDSKDNRVYLFTQCEPNYCRRIFPCFDQPNLRARFKTSIKAPSDWVVVTNEGVQQVTDVEEQLKVWTFKETPPLPTYLWVLAAGEYNSLEISGDARPNNCGVPCRLYCRKSKEEVLKANAERIYEVFDRAVNYLVSKLKIPFPFSKCDFVYVPGLDDMEAMENVGLVTFDDDHHLKDLGKGNKERILYTVYIIVHELVHMYFGNLVTLDWWDDLWLNESFATFIGYFIVQNDPVLKERYPGAFIRFLIQSTFSNHEDAYPLCRAVSSRVRGSEVSEHDIFTDTTYYKGGRSLLQLYQLLGDNLFFTAMNSYLRHYEWGCATTAGFIEQVTSLCPSLTQAIRAWGKDYIITPGHNVLSLRNTAPGQYDILQRNYLEDDEGILRSHLIQVAVFGEQKQTDGKISQITRVLSIEVKPSPSNPLDLTKIWNSELLTERVDTKLIMGNWNALGYLRWEIAEGDVAYIERLLLGKEGSNIDDLNKGVLMWTLYNAVMFGRVTTCHFIKIMAQLLVCEVNSVLLRYALLYCEHIFKRVLRLQQRLEYGPILFEAILKAIKLPRNECEKELLLDKLVDFAYSTSNLKFLLENPFSLEFDAELKALIVVNACLSGLYYGSFAEVKLNFEKALKNEARATELANTYLPACELVFEAKQRSEKLKKLYAGTELSEKDLEALSTVLVNEFCAFEGDHPTLFFKHIKSIILRPNITKTQQHELYEKLAPIYCDNEEKLALIVAELLKDPEIRVCRQLESLLTRSYFDYSRKAKINANLKK